MIVGFNTDIRFRNEVFHIQTEEKGDSNPIIETLVYLHGEILLSRKMSYAHLTNTKERPKKVKTMMKTQHDQMIMELKGGSYSHLLSFETQNLEDRSLDEMVLDYLQNRGD
jgi:hypothetical protein